MSIAQQVVDAVASMKGDCDPHWDLPPELRTSLTSVLQEEGVESRWEMRESVVYRATDDSYVRIMWSRGLTEYQDAEADAEAEIVEPHEVTVTKYRKK